MPCGELNQWPFGSQADAQSTKPYQPGLPCSFNGRCYLLTMLTASVDEEDRGKEEEDDEAAEGGDEDDSGV